MEHIFSSGKRANYTFVNICIITLVPSLVPPPVLSSDTATTHGQQIHPPTQITHAPNDPSICCWLPTEHACGGSWIEMDGSGNSTNAEWNWTYSVLC